MSTIDDEYVTVVEAAALLRVAVSTIRRWIRDGGKAMSWIALLAMVAPALQDPPPADPKALLARWAERCKSVRTISADFVQDRKTPLADDPVRSTGKLRLFIWQETGGYQGGAKGRLGETIEVKAGTKDLGDITYAGTPPDSK